ncbi:MAG TPA: bifunctional diguanylate cyclase/phosphodiesterase [Solirubrobacteraceae bacterium]|nr:bifunctional diguanylate cyclase/phosphodiesterase [Solirubrobacteraceae bacterium]
MSLLRSTARIDASRPPARDIGELPGDRVTISADLPVFDVERMFLADPALSAMVLCDGADAICISRDWFFAQLVGPLGHGRSLYARHRIGHLPRPDTLMLAESTTPVDAAREVQARPADSRYHDIVVSFADGRFGTVSIADLFAEVAHTHAYVGLHDPLTGLANRRLFLERLGIAHRHAGGGSDAVFGVLFVDLDDFKPINDVFGHETGDEALVTIAQRLQRFEERPVTVARFGGDEFGVLIEDAADADAILDLAERIATALSAPMLLADERMTLAASIGVAIADGQCAPADLLRNADLAMYAAKRDNKGGYALYEAEMHARASKRLQLRSQLEVALEQEQFELHFQPLVELDDQRIVGAEALVRWRRSSGELVAPNHFIPICEQTGMIVALGSWVLREACTHGALWQLRHPQREPLSLSVNISPRQLLEPGFVDELKAIVADTGFETSSLILEITENVFIEDVASITARLEAIRRLGVRIALDDFGTGFSSLGYLARLPIDVLKLDRSFVAELGPRNERALFHGIVALAHSLELSAVAEGVETEEQLSVLREAGCDRGQGFLFERPMNAERMAALLQQQQLNPALRSVA